MKMHPISDDIKKMWRKYPLRIYGGKNSDCCNAATVLVRSMEGGYVTRNCSQCGKPERLPETIFLKLGLWVACPECKSPMKATLIKKNYGYECNKCDIGILLADLLPSWQDIV